MTVALVLAVAASHPARGGVPAPVPPASAPVSRAPAATKGSRRAGTILLVIGAVMAVPATYFLVRARQERNDLNPDNGLADAAHGIGLGLASFATLAVGGLLLMPPGSGASGQNAHPQLVRAPRGLTLSFTF